MRAFGRDSVWQNQCEHSISNDELVGKYLNTSHKDGINYARIWYNGDEILPESTYTPQYMEKHKLGKYAKNKDAEKKSQK